MEDKEIIKLYLERDESAIAKTDLKYGRLCRSIAQNILSTEADAEECVNDTYLQAWNAIPPQQPENLGAWLGRVVRNTALNLWKKNHRQKRYAGITLLLRELEDCLPSPAGVENTLAEKELTAAINRWLGGLGKQDRILFVRRYWYGESIKDLAASCGFTPKKLAKHMYTLRQSLKKFLEKEGYSL